jgi:hypothetical protein
MRALLSGGAATPVIVKESGPDLSTKAVSNLKTGFVGDLTRSVTQTGHFIPKVAALAIFELTSRISKATITAIGEELLPDPVSLVHSALLHESRPTFAADSWL